MNEVTRILSTIEQREPRAAEGLLPLVYEELRKLADRRLAQEKPGQTLQATALVHGAYLRLVDADQVQRWDSRGHFFAAAAEAMRRILVENACRKAGTKGGDRERIDFATIEPAIEDPRIDLDEVLSRGNELQQLAIASGAAENSA
jgi:RNA polymerase sigma factor (TIGR02999 family)